MKKYVAIFVTVFILLFVSSFLVFRHVNEAKEQEKIALEQERLRRYTEFKESIDVDEWKTRLLEASHWEELREEDKITFAFGSKTDIIDRVIKNLSKNNYVICHAVGGRMDNSNKGTYLILAGFDNEGQVRVLSPQENYQEKSYLFERIFENVDKVLLFDEEG